MTPPTPTPQGSLDVFERWSRRLDVALACASLLVLAPLLAVLALLVALEGPGAILSGHSRIGRDGAVFQSFRFRTGSSAKLRSGTGAPLSSSRSQASAPGDGDLSGIGSFLEETSLDQLPELLNVLRGEMSLVGPRPINAEEATSSRVVPFVQAGLRPGMTGLWRIRRLSDPSEWERTRLDEAYARRRSLRLYVRILLETVPAILARRGWY